MQSALCILHYAFCTMHVALCTLHIALCTLYYAHGGDSSAGTQALPVGKIILSKVFRKDTKGIALFSVAEGNFEELSLLKKSEFKTKIGKFSYISYISLLSPIGKKMEWPIRNHVFSKCFLFLIINGNILENVKMK